MKDAGLYLIIGGVAIFVLVFIGKIFSFIANNPILGLAFIAIIFGIILLLLNMIKENKEAKKDEPFRGVDK
jgi:MFS-type transporter involved in bile tolerance (Atg22 family)